MALTIVVVHPDLLGTYGDGGNGLVLVRRAEWRGIDVELVDAPSDRPLPAGDVYCLGGGEDSPQLRAAELLRAEGALARAVDAGAAVLAVCAGYQIAGRTFPGADGRALPGIGLLDVSTVKGPGCRAVGEVLAEPIADGPAGDGPGGDGMAGGPAASGPAGGSPAGSGAARPLPTLTGFENHGGVTTVGPGARPLARVVAGVGNGSGDGTEGAWAGRVVGTYLHGPVLARNPALADVLLGWATGQALEPLPDDEQNALRRERLAAVRRSSRVEWWRGVGRHR
jgi:lipid II isoglutaminyl synthase (glutamine-hydrolysing)